MSKKAPANKPKKSRRRLKRSVRRSLAAVLMITAIAIAAIPVPENYATDEIVTPPSGSEGTAPVITDLHDLSNYGYDATDKDEAMPNSTSFNLSMYKDTEVKQWSDIELWNQPGVYHSLKITPADGEYILNWQYMFYWQTNPKGGGQRGVLCRYNTEFYAEEAQLGLAPNMEYYTVEKNKFDAYFDSDGVKDGEGNMILSHTDAMRGMNADPLTDPTRTIELTFEEYDLRGRDCLDPAEQKILETYFKDVYEAKIKEFDAYKKVLQKDPDTTDPMPAKLSITPADLTSGLTSDQRLKYYCDYDTELLKLGKDYVLRSVRDGRPNKSGTVYVAQGGTPNENLGYKNDSDKFLVTETSENTLCAIGDEAFKNVRNIVTLDIPSMIGYIGNDAFLGATLMTSITIQNADVIGNRAFKDCTSLSSVTLKQGTVTIGAECFRDTRIHSLTLPSSIEKIGYGAFADCDYLTTVNMDAISVPNSEIGAYAFHNCPSLKEVNISKSTIVKIGDGAFSTEVGSQLENFTFPLVNMNQTDSIGDYMFLGCSNLKTVVLPPRYGRSKPVGSGTYKLPDNMFHSCSDLAYVEIPVDSDKNSGGYLSYNPGLLFKDVNNEDFYVKGPELSDNGLAATPRQCTWEAETNVPDNPVPYLYIDAKGVSYYEVCREEYLLCIRKNDDGQTGTLISCTFKPDESGMNIALKIPATVGNIKVTKIDADCFRDDKLNQEVVSLTIEDNSIYEIDHNVFEGWKKLGKVYIGNSVTKIGDEAFKDCDALYDVTFSSPVNVDYTAFSIGKDAFLTNGTQLTFHGDIVKGYAPFDWAMNENNIINRKDIIDPNDTKGGVRVCYKSLAPTYLTVMYNPVTELVTLLDYPKYYQISDILTEAHSDEITAAGCSTYENWMAARYYAQFADDTNPAYYASRQAFANAWKQAVESGEDPEALYETSLYGPWVHPDFCDKNSDKYWENYLSSGSQPDPGDGGETPDPDNGNGDNNGGDGSDPDESGDEDTENSAKNTLNQMTDWLFEPIVAYAAEKDPVPYYTTYTYDISTNGASGDQYRALTPEEASLLAAVEQIIVPDGVDSIDVYGYYMNYTTDGEVSKLSVDNKLNVKTYLTQNQKDHRANLDSVTQAMYFGINGRKQNGIEPGLFSGLYNDGLDENTESKVQGNDRIKSVTLTSVKYLPDYAFDSCEQLSVVNIGAACADIGIVPFRGCTVLTNVGLNNDNYLADNGIIYSKNKDAAGNFDGNYTIEECLYARGKPAAEGPSVGEATVPETSYSDGAEVTTISKVTAIRDGAFEDCDFVKTVTLTGATGLTKIPTNCFKDCELLQKVFLPRTVNEIEEGAFAYDANLADLYIPGKEVQISAKAFIDVAEFRKTETTIHTLPDSAALRYAEMYKTTYNLTGDADLSEWTVIFLDADGNQVGKTLYKQTGEHILDSERPDPAELELAKEGWVFSKWISSNGTDINGAIVDDTIFIAQGYYSNGMVDGKNYMVQFFCQICGEQIGDTQYVEPGKSATEPNPNAHGHKGYDFIKWSSDDWKEVNNNLVIMAMFSGSGTGNGNTGTTSRNSTSTSNRSSNSTNNNGSSSTSATSTSSSAAGKYTVTVVNGSGSGSYDAGSTVIIAANTPAAGKVFSKWTTESQGVTLASVSMTATTFVMPANNVTITANYVDGAPTAGGTASYGTTGNRNTGNSGNGGTRVDITKPGISNKDLATATVNGSTDNFIVKISETDEATQAVINALTNKYGNLDSILYYAMDISLYDSTGTTKITNTAGLSVDITIPIPDALIVYGGNNMAGAVVADQLEDLSERFTTINGVPCISFTATHFSPYTIYVNTQNLSEGLLDSTPKTGDPIHPKWFLSLGLACLSIILFMKKDKKRVNVKTA